jgi:hypothetical protein
MKMYTVRDVKLAKMTSSEVQEDPFTYYYTRWYEKTTNEPARDVLIGRAYDGVVIEINGNRYIESEPHNAIISIKLGLWGIK